MRLGDCKSRLPVAAQRFVLFNCLGILLLGGCSGSDGPQRVPLYGEVTVAGSPVARGSISLLPAEGHPGPAATTLIKEGRYEFSSRDGPVAGPHRVIVVLEGDGKGSLMSQAARPPTPAGQPGSPAKAPARRWELRAEVPATGPFEHDIALD